MYFAVGIFSIMLSQTLRVFDKTVAKQALQLARDLTAQLCLDAADCSVLTQYWINLKKYCPNYSKKKIIQKNMGKQSPDGKTPNLPFKYLPKRAFKVFIATLKLLLHLFDSTALSQTGHHLRHGLDLMRFLRVHELIWLQLSTWVDRTKKTCNFHIHQIL